MFEAEKGHKEPASGKISAQVFLESPKFLLSLEASNSIHVMQDAAGHRVESKEFARIEPGRFVATQANAKKEIRLRQSGAEKQSSKI